MENSQNKFAALAFITIFVILAIVALLFKSQKPVEAPIVEEKPVPSQIDPKFNAKIVSALSSFADVASDINSVESVCVGGFINDRVSQLKIMSEDIVKNRVINSETMQYATTQDEAGIICESSSSKWVLFSALNPTDMSSEPQYYCVDSAGAKGKFDIDRENVSCDVGEPIVQ